MNINFVELIQPTPEIAAAFSKWENDPDLIPFMRPNASEQDLLERKSITVEELASRLEHDRVYLIYLNDALIGEMGYQIDPAHLYKKEPNTAWIGITIGEKIARGNGIGFQAMQFLEERVKEENLPRMELGVFEFNERAIKLYKKLGFQEIARIDDFTYWQGKMWQDIRMEKYI